MSDPKVIGYFNTTHGQRVFLYAGKAVFVSVGLLEDEDGRRIVDEKLRAKLELGEGHIVQKEIFPPDWAIRDWAGWRT